MDHLEPDHSRPSENPSAGEGQKQSVDDMLAAALQYFGERGELDSNPVLVALEHVKPGKGYHVTCAFSGLQCLFCRRGPKAECG